MLCREGRVWNVLIIGAFIIWHVYRHSLKGAHDKTFGSDKKSDF